MSTPAASLVPVSDPLAAILDLLQRRRGSVIFDLDSTLIDNRPRQAQILRDFGASVGEPAFAAVRASHFASWDLKAALTGAGVPAAIVAGHLDAARRFWRTHFFTSAYCQFDRAMPGAVAFAGEVARRGQLVYLTGRPPQMESGTRRSLTELGFPVPGDDDTQLWLKPEAALADDVWKERAAALASGLAPVLGCFDNEPTHINSHRRAWPGAVCVWVDSDHSGRPVELLAGIATLTDFRR